MSGMMLRSPAKLTKYLKVTGRRPDGMHQLEAEMVSLSFGDTLEIGEGSGIEVVDVIGALGALEADLGKVPVGESNLIAKALSFVGRKAMVRLYKCVPPGSGLGGGSSNAAAILRHFAQGQLKMLEVAAKLGADVPFCIEGGRAIASGIGEILASLDYVNESFVLLLSPFGVSTKEVYAQYDLITRHSTGATNDLELAAQTFEPRLVKSKSVLQRLSGVHPTLAGSGSTYFIEGSFSQLELDSEPLKSDGFRYADIVVDGVSYRLVEATTLPRIT